MRIVVLLVGLLAAASIVISIVAIRKSSRIAVVKSGMVLEKFSGMREANKKYQALVSGYQLTIDSMKNELSIEESKIDQSIVGKTMKESIAKKTMAIESATSNYNQIAEEMHNRLTSAAISQFNTFVQKYAEEQGYDLVVGVTLSGNVLYSNQGKDITEEIIEGLNKSYLGK